jgi:hypothetical protein
VYCFNNTSNLSGIAKNIYKDIQCFSNFQQIEIFTQVLLCGKKPSLRDEERAKKVKQECYS